MSETDEEKSEAIMNEVMEIASIAAVNHRRLIALVCATYFQVAHPRSEDDVVLSAKAFESFIKNG